MANFNTSINLTGVDTDINRLLFTDTSVFSNTTPGHATFAYRRAEITLPSGENIVFSSDANETYDPEATYRISYLTAVTPIDTIDILSGTSVNDLYLDLVNPTDGVYTVRLYNFPAYDNAVTYSTLYNTIVYYNGKLYQNIAGSTGHAPQDSPSDPYWKYYSIRPSTDLTRYGVTSKVVVTGYKIDECLKSALFKVVSKSNPCVNRAERIDKDIEKAFKMKIVYDALFISTADNDWDSVDAELKMLTNFCDCGC